MKANNVTLLVCLHPSVPADNIGEISFYHLVNKVTPVRNVKLVSREGPIKAFVQVDNNHEVNRVMEALNEMKTNIGRIRIFVSHKKFINYEKPLQALLKDTEESNYDFNEPGSDRMTNFAQNFKTVNINLAEAQRKKVSEDQISIKQTSKRGLKKYNSSELEKGHQFKESRLADVSGKYDIKAVDSREESTNALISLHPQISGDRLKKQISVTNSDLQALKSHRITKVFSGFGSIVEKRYNSLQKVWTIQFETDKAALNATSCIYSTSFLGYELSTANDTISSTKLNCNFVQRPLEIQKSLRACYDNNIAITFQQTDVSCTIKIVDLEQHMLLHNLCRLIGAKHVPLQILEANDLNDGKIFFLAIIRTYEDAISTRNHLLNIKSRYSRLHVVFVCVSEAD